MFAAYSRADKVGVELVPLAFVFFSLERETTRVLIFLQTTSMRGLTQSFLNRHPLVSADKTMTGQNIFGGVVYQNSQQLVISLLEIINTSSLYYCVCVRV